jgi:ABC-type uncharacterized transport system involved in gliding motility auxiliary subunit
MKPRWERNLTIVCAVGGLLLLIAGGSLVLVEGGLMRHTSFILIAGLALLIAYAILDPRAVRDLVRSRRARFGSLSVVVTAVVLGILIAINVVASRGTQAIDVTRGQLYTLSPKSVLVTRQLDSDLTVTGFYRPNEETSKHQALTLLDLYHLQSPHVKVRMVDADQNAAQARALGVTITGSIVLQYKSKPPVVLSLAAQSEADVTGAILRLESTRQPVICWATGEGERDLKDTNQQTGYSAASDLLRVSSYQVLPDVLVAQQGVPANCDVLAVVGVLRPLSAPTVKAIQDYLDRGGKLFFAVDPVNFSPNKDGADIVNSTNAVLKPYGASFDGGLVVEADPNHYAENEPTTPVVLDFGDSPITKDLARTAVFFPEPTGISTSPTADLPPAKLATTSAPAYQIVQSREQLARRPTDRSGPFVLMETLEQQRPSGKRTRIVLVGTAGIAENRAMPPNTSGGNPDLFLASLDWLSEQESLIAAGPKPPAAQPLSLTQSQAYFNILVTLVLLPGLVLAAGVVVFVRRRRSVD